MKTLLLLRHAKSDRSTSLGDAERPLSERGRNAAPRIGATMAERGFVPDLALISPSERTRQTWALIAPQLKENTPTEFLPQLYLAAASRLLETIHKLGRDRHSLLILGHNPGLEDLAARLAAKQQSPEGDRALGKLKTKFPTCALAVLSFDIEDWEELRPGSGTVLAFITPSSLQD